MGRAWIAGRPVALDDAFAEAARLLDASRHPLIAGLGTDVAGARAAIALAKQTGAVIEHMHSEALLRDLDVMRSSGTMRTTPGEARIRADTLLLVGTGIEEAWPELPQRLFADRPAAGGNAERRLVWLCPGRGYAATATGSAAIRVIGRRPEDLPSLLATLRARIAGRPSGKASLSSRVLDEVSTTLKAARFGVAIWSAAALDALAIEMLYGIVNDLNASTRFSALPLDPADNAVGVLQTCGWMTGHPMRTGFGRGFPEHDPWRFQARRMLDSAEADCLVWISAYGKQPPRDRDHLPAIALAGREVEFRVPPRVHIEIGRPGLDHPGVEYVPSAGVLAAVDAARPSDTISAAAAIARIAALTGTGARPC
jgi:formylmethanofuran dehydrogenase subunit B